MICLPIEEKEKKFQMNIYSSSIQGINKEKAMPFTIGKFTY
jgi:hypothetical protein